VTITNPTTYKINKNTGTIITNTQQVLSTFGNILYKYATVTFKGPDTIQSNCLVACDENFNILRVSHFTDAVYKTIAIDKNNSIFTFYILDTRYEDRVWQVIDFGN
ncbi:hypothetical protein, partial [Clostridium sporogenes]|uniref:hypothetical protein n=1 Tax=Clostridium sporogenes TaxID=1509 RepID=UPI0006C2F8FF